VVAGIDEAEVAFEGTSFRFALNVGNLGTEIHHAMGRFFEEDELRYLKAITPSRAVIVDVGANIGNHAVFFAQMCRESHVIPIEPMPSAVNALRRNLALNALRIDERGLGIAASTQAGELALEIGPDQDLVHGRVTPEPSSSGGRRVRSIALDQLIPERVDLFKVDVEGHEAAVFRGAVRILSEDKPTVMMEMHPSAAADDAYEFLSSYGYVAVRSFDGVGYKNVVFRIQ
jgi:FkbM family methyltransferase